MTQMKGQPAHRGKAISAAEFAQLWGDKGLGAGMAAERKVWAKGDRFCRLSPPTRLSGGCGSVSTESR